MLLLKGVPYSHRKLTAICLAPGGLEIFLTPARFYSRMGCVLSWRECRLGNRRRPRPAAERGTV